MTASNTAVRGLLSAPGSTGVAWVSTTLPVPPPSTIRTTMVRGSGLVNSATTGILSRPIRNVTAHQETIRVLGEAVVDGWCGEHIKVRE